MGKKENNEEVKIQNIDINATKQRAQHLEFPSDNPPARGGSVFVEFSYRDTVFISVLKNRNHLKNSAYHMKEDFA